MRKKLLGIALMGVAAGIVFSACGEDGPTTTTCAGDGDCTTGNICHPLAKVCVTSCSDGNGCPNESKNCDSLTTGGTKTADGGTTGGTPSAKFCQCSTTALCGGGTDATIICAKEDKICTTKCTDSGQCGAGRTCNSATGDCETQAASGGGAGGGGGGSCDWSTCSSTASSASQCNGSACGAGAACTGTGKSSCANNSACYGSACGWPARPQPGNVGLYNCQNFFTGSHANGPAWNPTSSTGPVIYEVNKLASGPGIADGGAQCGTTQFNDPNSFCHCQFGSTEFKTQIKAYKSTAWPTTRTNWATQGPALFYVNTGGSDDDVQSAPTSLLPNTGYNPAGNDVDVRVYHCLNGTAASFQPGFYFTGGNEFCKNL